MKLSFKRFMSMFLSILMIVSMMPLSVLANEIDLNDSDLFDQLQGIIDGSDSADVTLGHPVGIYTTNEDNTTDYQSYATFEEALEKASGATGEVVVEIYDKVTLNTSLSGSYDSIKFVGKDTDAEIYLEVQGYITATGKKVAFENLTLSKSAGGFLDNAGFMNVAFGVYDVNEVTYTNCTFTNGAYASSGEVTFTDCTFYRSHDKYGLWAYGDVDVIVDDCTFADYRGIKMYAEGAAKTVDLKVKDTDFSAVTDKPAIVLTYGESVTLAGNTYSSTGTFELDLDGAPNGTTVTSDVAPTCKNDNGACGVLVDGKIYTTVEQAAAVAEAGDTVTLLHNSTETVEFAEGVTLDKNGYTAENVTVTESADPEKGYMLYIYNADGTLGMDIDGTKSASVFSLKTAIEDARVFVDNAFLFGITTPVTYVVEMYEDSYEDESFEIGSDVTINGNGHKIVLAAGVEVTTNGTLNDVTVEKTVTYVAQIGGTKYETLQAAIDAVQNGETIVFTGDITEELVTIEKASGVAFTIDGKDNNFTGEFEIGIGESIVIQNINFVASAEISPDYFIDSMDKNSNCVLTIQNCTFTDTDYSTTAIGTHQPTKVVIDGCTTAGVASLLQNQGGYNITVKNTTVEGKRGISLGTVVGATVENVKITAADDKYGIRLNGEITNNTITIKDCDVTAFIPVVVRKASVENYTVIFDGTNTMTAKNTDGLWCAIGTSEYETNGTMPTDPAGKVTVTLNDTGLDAKGVYGEYVETPKGNDFTGYTGSDAIWGETWGNARESFVIKVLDANGNVMGTTSLNNIGGIIDGDVGVTWNLKLDAASNTDEYWTMVWTTAPTIDNMPAKVELWVDGVKVSGGDVVLNGPDGLNPVFAAVTENGAIKSFVTNDGFDIKDVSDELNAALAAGGNVVLLDNIALEATLTVPADAAVVLDLNGKTLSYTSNTAGEAMILNRGTLTLKNGDVALTYAGAVNTGKAANTVCNYGSLTIDGADVTNTTTANGQIGYAVDNYSGATLTVKSGSVNASGSYYYDSIRLFCNSESVSTTVVVEGGTVGSIWMQNPSDSNGTHTKDVTGSVTISGGTVAALYLEPSTKFEASVTGGHVGKVAYHQTEEGRNVTGFITGGTFSADVSDFVAGGFKCEKNENGTYGVTEKAMPTVNGVDVVISDKGDGVYDITLNAGASFPEGGVTMTFPATGDANGMAYVVHEHEDGTYIYVGKVTDGKLSFKNTVGFSIFTVVDGGLQEALNAAVAGTGNVTVEILDDIDLTNVDWAPVTVSAPGYPKVTVNGNNKTITGLNDMLFAGTWAGGSGLIINNLTIKDSTIVNDENDTKGTVGVGAFIGFPQASATITLNNCHLVNSTVKGGHWTGGLIGYAAGYAGTDGPVFMTLTIKDCSVTDSTITGKGSVGGIIGHATGNAWTDVVIETTTVSGNTVTSTGSSTNKAGAVVGTIGAAGQATTVNGVEHTGGVAVSANVSGNTVTSNGTTITTVYGRQGTNTGMLEIAGGSYDSNPIEENVSYAAPAEGYMIVENTDGSFGLAVDPAYGKVAKIGDTYYETIAEAIAAAKAGDEIVLLADVAEDITVPAGVTFNGNGKTVNGTIMADGDLTFKGATTVSTFNPGWYNNTITIGEDASLKVTSGRMTVSYGNVFNIVGSIADAKTADKSTLTPSLELVGGISFNGNGSGVQFNVTNAYVKLGDSTTKNSGATGEFNINLTNSIVDFTKTLKTYMPTADGLAPKFNFVAKDSVVEFVSHLELWLDGTDMTLDNTDLTVGGSFANAGDLKVTNGSNFVVKAPIMSSHGGNTGSINVSGGTFELKDSNENWVNEGTIAVANSGKLIVNDFDCGTNGKIEIDVSEMNIGDSVKDYIVFGQDTDVLYENIQVTGKKLLVNEDGILVAIPVASINGVTYATLEEAFKAATDGCTIEILADVVVDYKWDCRDYATNGSHSQFKESVTINGNDHTIKFTGTINDNNWNTVFRFEENATVNNLKIDISEATGAQRVITAKKSLTVDGLTVIGSAKYGIIFGEGASATDLAATEIVIKNSTLTGTRRAISDNEGGKDVKSIVITGNTLNANVYVSAFDNVTFTGNNVTAGYVDIRSYTADNTLDVTAINNTLTANTETECNYIKAGGTLNIQDDFVLPASGEVAYRAYIEDSASREAIKVDLQNVYATTSVVVKLYDANGNLLITTTLNAGGYKGDWLTTNIVLSGTPSGSWNTEIHEKLTVANVPTKVELYIDGSLLDTFEPVLGNATDAAAYQLPAYLALDCVYKEAKIGDTYYATLAEAIAAAQAGETITIVDDIALTEGVTIPAGANIIIDLNGKTISGTDTTDKNFSLITNKGNLTIKDSVGTGKITLTATLDTGYNRYSTVISNTVGGKLVVESGTIEHLGGHTMAYAIDNLTNGKGTYAETVINGGTIKSSYVGIRQFLNGVEADNILTVNGGTVTGNNTSIFFQDPSESCNSGKLVVGENATLGNRIYVSGTEGSEWDVEISVSALALGTYGITTVDIPATYTLKEVNGVYGFVKAVASINGTGYATLAEALAAAQNDETITLIWTEGDAPIAMNGSVYGKTVTITGTATVDWSKGFLFVGRGGEGDGTVIFDNANLISASDSSSYGIHVSGREKNTDNKYDGTLVIKNSTIELDYLINRGKIELENNANLTVKNGFGSTGRPATETESGEDATSTITLKNGSKLVVDNHNGMGLGLASNVVEGYGIMTVESGAIFETTQSFRVTAKGTLNLAGTATIAGTLTNNGAIVLTNEAAILTSSECGNVTTNVAEKKVVYENGAYKLAEMDPVAQIGNKTYTSLQDAIDKAEPGDTITVIADHKLVWDGETMVDGIYCLLIVKDKSITLDLNGMAITADMTGMNAQYNIGIAVVGTGDLTVKATNGGSFKASGIKAYSLFSAYNDASCLTIDGGEYVLDEAMDCLIHSAGDETVTVNGGTFTLGNVGNGTNGQPWIFNANGSGGRHVYVTGGTYNANIFEQFWRHEVQCDGKYAARDNGNGTWTVVPAVAYVTVDVNGYDYYVGYETIAEAIAAAKAGETVTVFEGTYAMPAMKAGLTIVGEGNVIFEGTLSGTLEDLTMKNIHIKGANAQRWAYAKGDLVFENVTFEATSVYALHFDGISEGTTLLYKDCTIIGWAAMGGSPASCVFDGCTIKDNGAYGVIRTYFDATIENCTFDVDGANPNDVYQDGIHAVGGAEVTVNGCTNTNGDMKDLVNVSGTSVIVVDGVVYKNVAKIGENYYGTLEEALTAAQPGDTVTILAGDYTTDITLNKTITLAGETDAEGNNLVNITGRIAANTGATVKNLNVHNEKTGDYDCALVVNGKDIVVDGVKLTGYNAMRYCYASGDITIKNSTINGSNFAVHFDGSAGGNIVLENCDITGWCSYASTVNSVSYTNCDIDQGQYAGHRYYNKNISFTECDFADGFKIDLEVSDTNVAFTDNDMNMADVKALFNDPYYVAKGNITLNGEKITYVASAYTASGSKYFDSLQDAINEVNNGGYITVRSDIVLTAPVTVPAGKAVEIGLGDYNITYTSDVIGEAMITNNGELTVSGNGKILYTYTGAADSNYGKGNYTIANNGKLTIDGVTVENATASMKHAFYAITNGNGGEIIMKKGLVLNTNNYAVRMFGNGSLTVEDGEIKGTRAVWMQAPGSNTADAPVIALTVNGGKLTATGESADYKLAVYSYTYGNSLENVSITVNGGELDGDIALSGGANKTVAEKVTITGGTITDLYSYAADEVAAKTVNVSGGTFKTAVAEAYCAEGFIPTENADGTYGVKAGKYVAKIDTVGYETIDAALTAAQPGETVTILAGDYTTTLNVNKAITVVGETDDQGNNLVNITGKLNITADGATVKNLNVNNGSGNGGYINAKDVLVEGCTVVGGNGFRSCYTTGTVTFKDSTITGSVYGIHFDGYAGGNIVIENCVITGWTSFASSINKVTIKDTEFADGNYDQLRFYQDAELTNVKFNPNMNIDFGKENVSADFNGCSVTDGSNLTDVIYLPDIAEMGIKVKVDNDPVVVEAMIGDTAYLKLEDAFAAAKDGDEVKIYAAGTYALSTSGRNITITGMVDGVVFDNIGAKNMGSANVTFNKVTFDYYPNVNYTGLQHSGDLVYNNCTINGQVFLYGTSETFNNCTFNQNSADAYNVWTYGAKEVAFNECTFNSAGKSVLIYSEQSDLFNTVSITDCDFIASAPVDGKAAIEMDSSLTAGINLTIDGETTATGFGSGNVSGNSLWNNKKGNNTDANNDITVVVDGVTVLAPIAFVAKIGDTGYTSLADAIAAVGAGDVVIELLADATFDYNARDAYGTAETTSLTINGNGHTLTLNQKDSDWASIGLANADAKLALNDMTIEKTGYGDTSGAWNTHAIIFSCNVEMTDVTVNNSVAVQNGATFNNVTINEANGYYGLWINGNGQTVTVTGGEINATNGGRGIKIADEYVDDIKQVTLNVTGTKFNTAKKAAVLVTSTAGAKVTASNVDITNVVDDSTNMVWVDEDRAANFGKVEATGATIAQEAVETFNIVVKDGDKIVSYFKTLDELFDNVSAYAKVSNVTVELTGDVVATKVVKTNSLKTYNFVTNVAGGVTMDLQYADNWNYFRNVNIGENVTVKAQYLVFSTESIIAGTVDCYYPYISGGKVTVAATGVLKYEGGDGLQVKDGAILTVNGTVIAPTINVWKGNAQLIVSGANAKVEASWIDIWDGTPSVSVENGATLDVDSIKASRGGSITVDNATLAADKVELGHNGESVGELTVTNNGTVTGEIQLTAVGSTLEGPEGLNVTTNIADHKVVYDTENGVYKVVPCEYVAKIGDKKYESLATAITAAQANDTIIFLADITENVIVDESITIDGHSHKFTGTMNANAKLTVTVQNVKFVNGAFYKDTKSTNGNYTIKNCTFVDDGTGYYAFRFKGANSITIEDCTVKGYMYSFLYITSGTNTVSVKNVTVEDCSSYAVYFASGVNNALFENLTVKNSNNGFIINNTANRAFTIKNCTMENVVNAISEANGTNNITCTVLGANNFGTAATSQYAKYVLAATDATLTAPADFAVTTSVEGDYTVKYDVDTYKVVAAVAKVGDKKYETLAEAFAAAQAGDTVTLLADVELTETITVAQDVTFDLGGKVVSGYCAESQAHLFMVNNGAELTIKDSTGTGKITYAGVNSTGWIIDVEGALVLESGTLELTGTWSIGYAVDVRPNAWGTAYTEPTTFTMNGGKIQSSDGGVRVASSSSDTYPDVSASFEMNGGVIVADWDAIFVQQSNAAWDKLNVTVNDGTITSNKYLIRFYGPAATSYVSGEDCVDINLNGGTLAYTGTGANDWLVEKILTLGGGVTAEEFLKDSTVTASEEFAKANVADGYEWVKGTDGKYTLEEKVEVQKFDITFANMNLKSSMAMNFAFPKSAAMDWTGHYAEITKEYADGRANVVQIIDSDNWSTANINGVAHYYVTFTGIAAKEMTDNIYVVICDENGNAVSETWVDSVRDYAMRTLNNPSTNAETLTQMVDMLNYGAAAQDYFSDYNIDDLANSKLTDIQKTYASSGNTEYEDTRIKGENYLGSSLLLKENIMLLMAFKNVNTTMNVKISYVNHYGNQMTVTSELVDGAEYGMSGCYVVVINSLAIADARQNVTVSICDSNDNIIASATDSIESYIAREMAKGENALYDLIMKFADSSYAAFH